MDFDFEFGNAFLNLGVVLLVEGGGLLQSGEQTVFFTVGLPEESSELGCESLADGVNDVYVVLYTGFG